MTGDLYGLPKSTLVHRLANIACSEFIAGEHCRIDAFVTLTGKVKLGNDCHIGTGASILAFHGFEAGDRVGISPGVKIFTATTDPRADCLAYHSTASFEAKPYAGPVRIGNSTVVGANSVILPNATIGSEVVVGACSTVKGALPSGWIYAGNPAKPIRAREPLKYGR